MKKFIEHKLFITKVRNIFEKSMLNFNFVEHTYSIDTYGSDIIYKNNDLYIKISANTHPMDGYYSYNIILGEGSSDDFFEYDWNSIALWRLINYKSKNDNAGPYEFPSDTDAEQNIINAHNDLVKYGNDFLNNKIEIFITVRKLQNRDREPYKIHKPQKDGRYKTFIEKISSKMKKKYS